MPCLQAIFVVVLVSFDIVVLLFLNQVYCTSLGGVIRYEFFLFFVVRIYFLSTPCSKETRGRHSLPFPIQNVRWIDQRRRPQPKNSLCTMATLLACPLISSILGRVVHVEGVDFFLIPFLCFFCKKNFSFFFFCKKIFSFFWGGGGVTYKERG